MSTSPTVLTAVDWTRKLVLVIGSAPSAERTVRRNGNDPEVRASTANRTVVLRGGRSTRRLEPSGNASFWLSSCTSTLTVWPVLFWNVSGISPDREVKVIVDGSGTWICEMKVLTVESTTDSSPSARAAVAGVLHADETDETTARSASATRASPGVTSARNALSRPTAAS